MLLLVLTRTQHIDIKKGAYVDGHERDDVVAYRNDVFLPKIKELKAQLAELCATGGHTSISDISYIFLNKYNYC